MSGRTGMRFRLSRGLLAAVCLALIGVLLAGAALLVMQRSRPQPGVWTGVPPSTPLAADKSLGINVDLSRYDAAGREAVLAQMESAGFRWLRQRFPWEAIEPARRQFAWNTWDEVVTAVSRHKMTLIAVLDGSPRWARAEVDAANASAPPVGARDYGAFVTAFAARYGDRIDYYQVWDEPNIAPHWGAREIDPAGYTALLREGAIEARSADPGAVILLAALAPNVESGGANLSELAFLSSLYESGAGEWFDVASVQLYLFEQAPGALPDPGRLDWRRAALLRQVMEAHGDASTPVWGVRFGWPDQAAGTLGATVDQARQDWPWLGPMLWTAWSLADAHGEYALTDVSGKPVALYDALNILASRPAIAWPGVYTARDASGQYQGSWRLAAQGADIGASGDRLAIRFWGSRLDLAVRRGDYRAFLYVTIDGRPANALPRDTSGRAYVVLYDPLSQPDTVTLSRGLPAGEHEAEIVADRGWGQWAIVGWTASREVDRGRLPAVLAVAGLVWLGAVVALAWRERRSWLASVGSLLARYRALDDRLSLAITAGAVALAIACQGTLPSLFALGVLAIALFLRPETGLPLIAIALPFYQPGKPLLGKVFSFVEILTVLTAIAWAANRVLERISERASQRESESARERFSEMADRRNFQSRTRIAHHASRITHHVSRFTSLDWAVIALVAWSALSLLWSAHTREAAREFRTVILEAGLFYGLLRAMVRSRRDVWRLADAWLLGAVAIAAIGIGQWAFGRNVITADGVWRVRGFYGSPNNLAIFLGRVFPLALVVAGLGHAAVGRARRWAYGLGGVLIAVALFLTYSRGAWLIGVPAALLFIVVVVSGSRRRRVAAAAMLLVVVLAAVVLIAGAGRLTSLLDSSQGTTFFRLQLWQSSLAMVRDHPLLGVGLDNFLYAYRTRYVLPTAWEEFNLSHPHNVVLDFWLSLGLAGVVLLGWLLVAFFRRGVQAYRRLPAGGDRALVLGLMAGMVNFAAHGLVDASFFLVDLAFVFMLMVSLIQYPFESGGCADQAAVTESES